jgi:hypothetical protein
MTIYVFTQFLRIVDECERSTAGIAKRAYLREHSILKPVVVMKTAD